MNYDAIETHGHTTADGTLNLSINVGVPDSDVTVILRVKPVSSPAAVDTNGWPLGFFDRVAGSMPELERSPQGQFEERQRLQ